MVGNSSIDTNNHAVTFLSERGIGFLALEAGKKLKMKEI